MVTRWQHERKERKRKTFWFLAFGPLSGVNFHIFDFSTEIAEPNSTKLDRKHCPLHNLCFVADWKTKMATLASEWLILVIHLLWNCRTEFNDTWQEARSQRHLPSLCFWADPKNKMAARRLISWDIFNFSFETTKTNSTKLDRKQDLNALYEDCVFGPIGKMRWPPWWEIVAPWVSC